MRLTSEGENLYLGDREGQIMANVQKTIETGASDMISELFDAMDNYYDLNGMRVEKPVKGIFIKAGKKVVIK